MSNRPFITQIRKSLEYSAESDEPVEVYNEIALYADRANSEVLVVIYEETSYSYRDLMAILTDFMNDPTDYGMLEEQANWQVFVGHSSMQPLPEHIHDIYNEQFDREFSDEQFILHIKRS